MLQLASRDLPSLMLSCLVCFGSLIKRFQRSDGIIKLLNISSSIFEASIAYASMLNYKIRYYELHMQ